MPERSFVLWSVLCLTALAVLLCLWLLSVGAYQRFFLDMAIIRFLCLQELPDLLAHQLPT
ncbi:hypothetical protein [Roseibium sp. MMSF_3412]|uniref:hypothetical protein n=1 Tax=Roseibium sp. MMSF_3412 TaxID=3046712 RepID=UPI00273E078C|nr:hypothetical protein [Roseibium sp. MMSF_3412]